MHEKQKEQRQSGDIKLFGSANTKSMTDSLVLFTDIQKERKKERKN